MIKAGHEDRLPTPLSFRAWLNQSYIDLSPPVGTEHITPWGIEIAYRSFANSEDLPRFNSIFPTNYRRFLRQVTQDDCITVAINLPSEVPREQRTGRWENLCSAVDTYHDLSAENGERLIWLLHRLCFHRLIVELTESTRGSFETDIAQSRQVTRAIALSCLAEDAGAKPSGKYFERILDKLRPGSSAEVEVSYKVLIEHTKFNPNLEAAIMAATKHRDAIERSCGRLSKFRMDLLWSRFYRVRAFVPMLAGDMNGMVRDMDLAEQYARNATPASEPERCAALEILFPVLESRIREAQVLGDQSLAEQRARILVEAAPLNPRAWLHFGEALLNQEKYEEAIPVYREARRLGPPASQIALFNLGQCYEMLDEAEAAMDTYAELLELDPFAISAAERLASIAEEVGGRYRAWSASILNALSLRKLGQIG